MIRSFLVLVDKINTDLRRHTVKAAVVILVLTVVYILSGNIFLSFIIASAIAIFLFNWDSRIFIAFGLIFLASSPILLVLEKKATAEEIAVYGYYMFGLSVILQVMQYFKESFSSIRAKKSHRGTETTSFLQQK